jgi:hypothetical protein
MKDWTKLLFFYHGPREPLRFPENGRHGLFYPHDMTGALRQFLAFPDLPNLLTPERSDSAFLVH